MRRAGVLVLLLTGCGPSLSGEWSGDLDCDTVSFGLSADLDKTGKNLFAGPMAFLFEGGENDATYTVTIDFDTEFRIDGGGPQDLDFEANYVGASCAAFRADGSLISDNCTEMGIDTSSFETIAGDVDGTTWDGADVITISQEGCSGSLTRM